MREILDANILFISLCPLGKNGFATLYKAETEHAEFTGLTKALDNFDEKGQLAAVVWAPDRRDSEGDFASAATVEKMAHSFLRNGAEIDLMHDCKPLNAEDVYVAESFIIQKGDPRFANVENYDGNVVDVTGGWGVIMQINSPELRKAYREGEWAGVSMYGPAKVREVETVDKAKVEAIRTVITQKETEDMKPEEIQALVDEKVTEALKKADDERAEAAAAEATEETEETEETTEKSEAPEIDLTDPEAVREHAKAKRIEALKADVDWNDPKAVEAYAEKLEKLQKGEEETEETEETDETDETAEKAEKVKPAGSNVSKGVDDAPANEDDEKKLMSEGRSFAAIINKSRGL
jgi:hypothetical protein